nr:hypothetical protein [Clostridium sp. Marseille-P7770]
MLRINLYQAEMLDDYANFIVKVVQKDIKIKRSRIIKALIEVGFYRLALCMPEEVLHDDYKDWVELVKLEIQDD